MEGRTPLSLLGTSDMVDMVRLNFSLISKKRSYSGQTVIDEYSADRFHLYMYIYIYIYTYKRISWDIRCVYMIPVSGFLTPPPTPPQCDDPVHTTHCWNDYSMEASLLLWRWVGRNIGTPLHAVTKSPTPSNLIGSMMILRVLPIHVPPCYEGGIP